MLELGYNTLADMLALLLILRLVASKSGKDSNTTPFRTFVERNEELAKNP